MVNVSHRKMKVFFFNQMQFENRLKTKKIVACICTFVTNLWDTPSLTESQLTCTRKKGGCLIVSLRQ